MKSNVDATYITNTLSYIHLLPKNEQTQHVNRILNYFRTKSKRKQNNTPLYMLLKRAINIIDKTITLYK